MKYRNSNDGLEEEMSDLAAHVPVGESMTVQSMTADADINVLMERFGITGKFPENVRVPQYADFGDVHDFHSALEAVSKAQEAFDSIPARARAAFENDPQKLLDFMSNGGNMEQLKFLASLENRDVGASAILKVNPDAGGAPGEAKAAVVGDAGAVGSGSKGG